MDLGHALCDALIFWHMHDDINKKALMEAGFPHFFICIFPVLFQDFSWSQLRFYTGLPANLLNEVP